MPEQDAAGVLYHVVVDEQEIKKALNFEGIISVRVIY
jgi:hypothetical protein